MLKQVKFTADLKYYENTTDTFDLQGTYKILPEGKIEITPGDAGNLTYQLNYRFNSEGQLTLSRNQFEGTVAERYSLEKN